MKQIITKCPHWVPATGIFVQSVTLKVYWDKTQNFCCDLSVFQITRCTLLHSIKGCANSVRMRHHHLLKLCTTGLNHLGYWSERTFWSPQVSLSADAFIVLIRAEYSFWISTVVGVWRGNNICREDVWGVPIRLPYENSNFCMGSPHNPQNTVPTLSFLNLTLIYLMRQILQYARYVADVVFTDFSFINY